MDNIVKEQQENKLSAPAATATTECGMVRPSHAVPNRAFNILNYIGLGWVANSTLSLLITYNLLPKPGVQKGIGHLAEVLKPVIQTYYRIFNPSKLEHSNQLNHVMDKARSAAEILCMCVAGTFMIFPMKLMENHKQWWVDKFDRIWNRKYYRECERQGIEPTSVPENEKDKPSWGKLITARLVGMGAVISIDQGIEAFNNARHGQGKGNLDTAEWKLGSKIYDKMPPTWRDKFINFFSRKNIGIEKIQPHVRERLMQTVGTDPKRMIFAEQTRLFSKEISLTLVMAGLIYALSKTPAISYVLHKIGLKKAEEKTAPEAAPVTEKPVVAETASEEKDPENCYACRFKPKEKATPKPTQRYTDIASKSTDGQLAL